MKLSIHDALTILNITESPVTQEIRKRAYQKAVAKYHPDRNPAGHKTMQLVNVANDLLKSCQDLGQVKVESQIDYGGAINQALNAIILLTDLHIEICGAWVWVSGNTKEHKETLKTAGFRWGAVKKCWYFRPHDWKSKNRKPWSMSQIRDTYGSEAYRHQQDEKKKLSVAA